MAARDEIRKIAEQTGTTYKIPVDQLYIAPEFDREEYGDLTWLSQQIAKEGFREDKPILVTHRPDLGLFEVMDGRHRTKASIMAKNDKESGFDGFVWIKHKSVKNREDILIETLQAQIGVKPFTNKELGKYYSQLMEAGKTIKEVAQIVNRSDAHVSEMVKYHKAPTENKELAEQLVKDGKISKTAALVAINKGIDLSKVKTNRKGKIDVQTITKAAKGHFKHISVMKIRKTLSNVKAASAQDSRYDLVAEVISKLLENEIYEAPQIA